MMRSTKIHMLLASRQGFSLFEMLVAVFITMLIAGALVTLLTSQIQLSTSQNRNIINQASLRDAIGLIGDEISNAGSGCDEPFVTLAYSNQLEIIGDQDGDGSPDKILYTVNGANLTRQIFSTPDDGLTWTSVSTDTVLDNVNQLSFTYYGFNNVTPATVDDITAVEIMLEINKGLNTTAFNQNKVSVESMLRRVTIRNRLL